MAELEFTSLICALLKLPRYTRGRSHVLVLVATFTSNYLNSLEIPQISGDDTKIFNRVVSSAAGTSGWDDYDPADPLLDILSPRSDHLDP